MFESCTRNLFLRSSCFTRAPFFCLIAFLLTAISALISMLSLCFSSVNGHETVGFSCLFYSEGGGCFRTRRRGSGGWLVGDGG